MEVDDVVEVEDVELVPAEPETPMVDWAGANEEVTEAAPAAQEAAEAAPAAESSSEESTERRLTMREAGAKILLCSWNPGSGARNLVDIIDNSGYNVVALQEAKESRMHELPQDRWASVLQSEQFIGARKPATCESLLHRCPPKGCCFHFAEVTFPEPRAGLRSLRILSLHLKNLVAKKPQAAPDTLAAVIDECEAVKPVDLICGDLNMARFALCFYFVRACSSDSATSAAASVHHPPKPPPPPQPYPRPPQRLQSVLHPS